ncbi:MAG TPA: VIT domain-containing protein [Trichormus sp.]
MSKFLSELFQGVTGLAGGHNQGNRYSDRIVLFGGVLLPLVAAVFEATTHFCAHHFFDPFPSTNHLLLFLLIPLSNFLALLARHNNLSEHYAMIALLNGMAGGVAIMYSLMFLPILGFSLLFTLALGFGLLGLAPMIAVPCTLGGGKIISRLAGDKTYFDPHQVEHFGHLIILVMVIAIELPSTLTRVHLEMADNKAQSKDGIKWLRENGNNEVMLRACYERSGRATDILGSLYEAAHPLPVDHARRIYYQVTGQPFNTVPLPAGARATISHAGLAPDIAGVNAKVEDEFDLDADIAGETVSGQARGLSLAKSELTGKIDSDALLVDLSWSFSFANVSSYEREARAKLLLPPGAVITGATLTIDGVEHPAEIMLRKKARTVYVQSVVKRQNPLLVSTCGPDEVLMQCFPVPPQKTILIKISLACPLALIDDDRAAVSLPTIMEKNFVQPESVSVDLASPNKLTGLDKGLVVAVSAAPMPYNVSGHLDVSSLGTLRSVVSAVRDPQCKTAFCKNSFDGGKTIVERRIARESNKAPRKLLIIVDGSKFMAAYATEIAKGLKSLSPSLSVELRLIGDETKTLFSGTIAGSESQFTEAMAVLQTSAFVGGQDDSLALVYLAKSAAADPATAVLWIHGAQPIAMAKKLDLQKVLKHASDHALVYDFNVCAGPDEILNGIYPSTSFVRVSRADDISSDLERLYLSWNRSPNGEPEFASIPYLENGVVTGHQTDQSLAQLYASKLILADVDSLDSIEQVVDQSQATQLASDYHLVTPVSSAVVTSYDAPDGEQKVATGVAPEADTWLLLIVAGGVIFGCIRIQRRKNGMARA